jgi:hypothetical protein
VCGLIGAVVTHGWLVTNASDISTSDMLCSSAMV